MESDYPDLSKEETRAIRRAWGIREEDPPNPHLETQRSNRKEAFAALKAASRAAQRNDLAAAKQWSEVAKRLSEAAERLANTPPPPLDEEEEQKLRDELSGMLARQYEWEGARNDWLVRKQIWDEIAVEAKRTGAPAPPPLPPPPPHWSDDLPEELRRKLGVYIEWPEPASR
jgi:hypothetical protein